MTPFINIFESFGISPSSPFGRSPFALWQNAWVHGWKLMDAWQQAWVPLLAPRLPGSGLPMNPLALFPNVAMHDLATTMMKNSPFMAMLPQVEARLTPLGEGDGDKARLSMRVHLPGLAGAAEAETLSVEALIARRQGRDRAALGCLEGVRLVYPAPEAPSATEPAAIDVTPTDVTAAAVKAVRKAPAAVKATAKASPRARGAAKKPADKPAED